MKSNHQFQTPQGPRILKTSAIVGVAPTIKGSKLTLQNGGVIDVNESYAELCELLEVGEPLAMPEAQPLPKGAPKRPEDAAQMKAPTTPRAPTELEQVAGKSIAPVQKPDATPKKPEDSAQAKADLEKADAAQLKLDEEKADAADKAEQAEKEKGFFGGKKHK